MSVSTQNVLRAATRGLVGMLLILAASASPAQAHRCRDDDRDGRPIAVPELDPGSMLGSLTLLIGGTVLLTDRRSRSGPQVGAD
jgi:hypothetical protein